MSAVAHPTSAPRARARRAHLRFPLRRGARTSTRESRRSMRIVAARLLIVVAARLLIVVAARLLIVVAARPFKALELGVRVRRRDRGDEPYRAHRAAREVVKRTLSCTLSSHRAHSKHSPSEEKLRPRHERALARSACDFSLRRQRRHHSDLRDRRSRSIQARRNRARSKCANHRAPSR